MVRSKSGLALLRYAVMTTDNWPRNSALHPLTRPGALLLVLIGFNTMQAQQPATLLAGVANLPDAPDSLLVLRAMDGPSTPAPATSGLSGTVADANGQSLEGARVSLAPRDASGERVVFSERDGTFAFSNLPTGTFMLTVTAPGLQVFVSPDVQLRAGVIRALPRIVLAVAGTTEQVTVTASQVEIAQEQIKEEEKQRLFGVIPNFYSSYIWNAAPLDTRQKFNLAFHSILDPVNFIATGGIAGGNQITGRFSGYGPGAEGYAKRYGAAFADNAISRIIGSAALPALLRQDPRYFYKGTGSTSSRALYAVTRAVITRGDNGKAQPNYSRILGSFAAGAIANAYHPAADRGVGLTVSNGFIDIGGTAADGLLREFVFRHLTPKVPDYATGEKAKAAVPVN